MIRTYYRGAHVAFLVYDTTSGVRIHPPHYRAILPLLILALTLSKTSIENLRKWVDEVELYAPSTVVKVLVGTKSDLDQQRTVSTDQAQVHRGVVESLHSMFIAHEKQQCTEVRPRFLQISWEFRTLRQVLRTM